MSGLGQNCKENNSGAVVSLKKKSPPIWSLIKLLSDDRNPLISLKKFPNYRKEIKSKQRPMRRKNWHCRQSFSSMDLGTNLWLRCQWVKFKFTTFSMTRRNPMYTNVACQKCTKKGTDNSPGFIRQIYCSHSYTYLPVIELILCSIPHHLKNKNVSLNSINAIKCWVAPSKLINAETKVPNLVLSERGIAPS